MSNFVDVAYLTQAFGRTPTEMQALMAGVILQKNVLDGLGLRVTADATTPANPITRTIQFAFGPSGMTDASVLINNDSSLEAVVMGNRGDDYIRPPFVSLLPKVRTSAQLRAFLRVKDFFLVGGGGYATPPAVTFLGGLPPAGRNFRGCVRTIYMKDPGLGYPLSTTVSIAGGGPPGPGAPPSIEAKAAIVLDQFGRIVAITLTDMGAGYTQVPQVVFHTHGIPVRKIAKAFVSMAEGQPAQATATILAGAVNGIALSNQGGGYVGVPDVVLTGGGFATPARVTARMEVERVDTLFGGSGYSIPTVVVFTPYFKSLFPDGTGQDRPFFRLFQPQFVTDVVTPIISLAPVLS